MTKSKFQLLQVPREFSFLAASKATPIFVVNKALLQEKKAKFCFRNQPKRGKILSQQLEVVLLNDRATRVGSLREF